MAAEKQITPGTTVGSMQVLTTTPTDADLAAFQGSDQQRAVDLATFMEGTPHAQGGQHDMFARGLTTDTGIWQQPPDPQDRVSLIPPQPPFVPSPGDVALPPAPPS